MLLCSCVAGCARHPLSKEAQRLSAEEFVIAFGSCDRQDKENVLWDAILKNHPKVWIWGGDNIYASHHGDPEKMKADYRQQQQDSGYAALVKSAAIMGTWDDHDYGLNDGGAEFGKKKESQEALLDFLKVPKDDERRTREGVYYARSFSADGSSIKIIVLDTRYFRTGLTKADDPDKRYQPNASSEGTLLGEMQWAWLQRELETSKAGFNIIVSSIQILSNQHGFETWGNFPHEVDRLKDLIRTSGAKGVLLLSGDRHISEFSVTGIDGVPYPVIDFTSSGLTHAYTGFTSEYNPYRMGNVVPQISFGLLKIDMKAKKIVMQMRGKDNILLQEYIQLYP